MKKMLDNDHAGPISPLEENKEHWNLPSFDVYHPQEPDQLKVVFDSSAEFKGVLNSTKSKVQLSGRDLNNSLLVVLLFFRYILLYKKTRKSTSGFYSMKTMTSAQKQETVE